MFVFLGPGLGVLVRLILHLIVDDIRAIDGAMKSKDYTYVLQNYINTCLAKFVLKHTFFQLCPM